MALIDDEADVLMVLEGELQDKFSEIDILSFPSADAFLGFIQENPIEFSKIDCVVSDYDMPGYDGVELFHLVREMRKDLLFILFTGRLEAKEENDLIIISKPNIDSLIEFIQKKFNLL